MGSFCALSVLPALLAAQPGRPAEPGCRGEIIAIISVLTRRPAELERVDDFDGLSDFGRRLWKPTSPEVVRGYLQLKEGERCTEFARQESERILRRQPFIADARIRVIRMSGDSIGLAVETRDDFPIIGGLGVREGVLSRLRLGTLSFDGTGIAVEAQWQQGFQYRDGVGVRLIDNFAFQKPWVLELAGRRDPLGSGWEWSLQQPFLTDLQRQAWYLGITSDNLFVPLRRGVGNDVLVNSDRTQWLAGLGHRIGTPRRSGIGGVLLEGENVVNGVSPLIATDSGAVPYRGTELDGRYPSYTSVRAGGVLGIRFLDFVAVRGFDALTGPQDVGRGVQASVRLTRSLWSEGGVDRDILVGSTLYLGTATSRTVWGLRLDAEGRRPRGDIWDGVIGSGRLAWYHQPTPRRLHHVAMELSGAWRNRLPFQVSAADRIGGLRGYSDARVGGGRRVVVRAEERWVVPPRAKWLDLGFAVFADGGRVWQGDVPFGVTTPYLASAGLSILAATPAGSKRIARLDVGFPLVALPGTKGVDVRLTVRDLTRFFWSEPIEVTRGRQGALRERIFRN
jgi:hypothetical protein